MRGTPNQDSKRSNSDRCRYPFEMYNDTTSLTFLGWFKYYALSKILSFYDSKYKYNHIIYDMVQTSALNGHYISTYSWSMCTIRCLLFFSLQLKLYTKPRDTSNAIGWHTGRPVDEGFDGVGITRKMIVTELDSWAAIAEMCTVFMEAADRPCEASIPAVTLRHCLRHCVYPLGIGECLIIQDFPGFCNAKNSYLGTCIMIITTLLTTDRATEYKHKLQG